MGPVTGVSFCPDFNVTYITLYGLDMGWSGYYDRGIGTRPVNEKLPKGTHYEPADRTDRKRLLLHR